MVVGLKSRETLSDAGFAELQRQLRDKAQWHDWALYVIDRWAPSSKTCSACCQCLVALSLSVSRWRCPACWADLDRDVNAAKNILRWGLASPQEQVA